MLLGVPLEYWACFFIIGFFIIVISCVVGSICLFLISQKD